MNILTTSKLKVVLLSVVVAMLTFSGIHGISDSKLNDYRIKIHSTTSTTTIRVDSVYRLYVDGKILSYVPASAGEDFVVEKSGSNISVKNSKGTVLGTGSEVQMLRQDATLGYFEVKGIDGKAYAQYPDNVVIRKSASGEILIINATSLETYLKGVLPHEMGSGAPLEALKAQAVTARTLAVKRVGKNAADGYDITNTTSDQVYKGYTKVDFTSTSNVYKAVEGTKGKVLMYKGSLLDGIFYSNNGGQTADDKFVWGSGTGNVYYVSKADPFDTYLNSYVAGWAKLEYTNEYTKEQLYNEIIANSKKYTAYFKEPYCTPAFNGLSKNFEVTVLKRENGYVTQVKISDDAGRSYILKNYANRWAFGLRSQQYTMNKIADMSTKSSSKTKSNQTVYVKNVDGTVVKKSSAGLVAKSSTTKSTIMANKYKFSGKGYGHGVGMSQNGAMNRANDGQKYTDILKFYYEGSTVGSNYGK